MGELRQFTLRGLSLAQQKPLQVWSMGDLGLDCLPGPGCEILDLFIPIREMVCEVINGDSPELVAVNLADRLDEDSLLRRGTIGIDG